MKYEGFEVSKRVENKANEIIFSATQIMEYQSKLEMHHRSLGNFMVNRVYFDWNLEPCWVALYNILKATMKQDASGYWIDKDILD